MLRTIFLALLSTVVIVGLSEVRAETSTATTDNAGTTTPKKKTGARKAKKTTVEETDVAEPESQAQQNAKPQVIVYSSPMCSYCTSAKALLNEKKVEYKEINVQGNKPLIDKMEKLTGKRTVPQIIINGEHIGGYTSLVAANMSGSLDEKLGLKKKDPTTKS